MPEPRWRSIIILIALLALPVASCDGPGGENASTPHQGPSLLLVTLDTVRADRIGCYGRDTAMTPVIDRLAVGGTLFSRVSAPTPVTLPSHATILTGSYPPGHGVRSNGVFTLADHRHTLAEMLAAEGYRTAAFVSAFVLDHSFGLAQGFETYDDQMPERDPMARFGFMAERRADHTSDRLIQWLEEGRADGDDRPFFAWLHLFDPHQDYVPPEPFAGRFAADPYDGEIAFSDLQVGRVLAALERLGLDCDTLVAVTADHGQSLGEHGEDTHGLFIYEGITQVPLVLALPGIVPAGAHIDEPVHLADLAPTLLELLGLDSPAAPGTLREQVQGRSLAPLMAGTPEPVGASRLYLETWHPRYNYGWSELAAIISDNQKYVQAPIPELYDLEADPAELDNLLQRDAGRWGDRGRELAGRLSLMEAELAAIGMDDGSSVSEVSDETRGKLLALGYVTGSGPAGGLPEGPAPDPKEMVHLEEKLFLAATLTQLERYQEALDLYLGVLAQSPGGHNVRFKAGFLCQMLGRDDEAEEHYRVALQYYPDSQESHYNLGVIFIRRERYPEALEHLARAVRLDPNNGLFQLDYGEALYRSGLVDKSLSVFRHAAELDPTLSRAHFNIGLAATKKGDVTAAEAAFRRALELAPDDGPAHYGLAACLHATGRSAEAVGHWERCLELDPQGANAESCRARLQQVR